jgi:hypothetical protein
MPFYSTGPHHCPNCLKRINKHGREVGEHLTLIESNHSGCGVDIVECTKCKKLFQISYKVDKITEVDNG